MRERQMKMDRGLLHWVLPSVTKPPSDKHPGMTREEAITSRRDVVTTAGFIVENMRAQMIRASHLC